MHYSPARSALRSGTAEIHAALEARIGPLDTVDSYARYVRGLEAFRRPLEACLAANWPDRFGSWRSTAIGAELSADRADLKAAPITPLPPPPPMTPAAILGAAYVLEGSSLGARVLCTRMDALGLSAEFGARHLWKQAAGLDNWRRFLVALESANDLAVSEATHAAAAAFEQALACMTRAAHE